MLHESHIPFRRRVDSYRKAVHKACLKAGVSVWNPNQIRHTVATRLREQYGLDAAQAVLGHESVETTQVYAEKNAWLAMRVIEDIG